MHKPRPSRGSKSLTSRFIVFSFTSNILLAILVIFAWNIGADKLGIPARITEKMMMEDDRLRSSLLDKEKHLAGWLSTRRAEADSLAWIQSTSPGISVLAASRAARGELDEALREIEAYFDALCRASIATSRILAVRLGDGMVLADSAGREASSVFGYAREHLQATSGQFRESLDLYSFRVERASSGIEVAFVLVAPMTAFLEEIGRDPVDADDGLLFALADDEGKVLFPWPIQAAKVLFPVGEVLIEKAALERLASNREPVALRLRDRSLVLGAAKTAISANDSIYIVGAADRKASIARILRDSAAMAGLALILAVFASLFSLWHIRLFLLPLSRLHVAVEAFERSESFSLPEDARGEVGEIIRSFSGLAQRVSAREKDLEAEVEMRIRMLKLTTELYGIFARDSSETATIAAANILKSSFMADSASLFYVNSKREYLYCIAGTDFPIALPESRWRDCVRPAAGNATVARFGPWSPPGLDVALPFWVSYRLYSEESEGGYIFLGKKAGEWSAEEEADLVAVAKSISPIVRIRRERLIEELVRQETEEKLAGNEKRLRTFVEGSRDMIYTADSRDIVTEINAAGLALLGRTDKADIVGRPFAAFADNPRDRESLLRRVRELGYAADFEIVLSRADGSRVFCLETSYAIRDGTGGIIELQGIVKDITERIYNENALWKTNLELAEANIKLQRTQALMIQQEKLASIGQLAAGIAHEINNPLSFLKSNHETFARNWKKMRKTWEDAESPPAKDLEEVKRRDDLPYLFAEVEKMLDESDDGFARIIHIVSNLKSFSRAGQGADFGLYDVNAGIESTLVVARNEIKYVADIKKDLGELPQIRARGSEVNQVILNILVNAAQAIEGQKRKEKGLIGIRTSVSGDRAIIEISDDGPGIPEPLSLKIFDPFFTTKEPGKGTGLGLSISYDIIVTKHRGHLEVGPSPAGGASFTIELPISGPEADGAGPSIENH